MFNQQRFLNVWALAAVHFDICEQNFRCSPKKMFEKRRDFDVGEQPITIKLCVVVMEMANKHDGNDINNNIKSINLSVTSLQVAELIFGCSIDHLR